MVRPAGPNLLDGQQATNPTMNSTKNRSENMTNILTETPPLRAVMPRGNLNIKKILVAVDLSPQSEKTVSFAVSLAKPLGAYINLIHVCSPEESGEVTEKKDNRFEEPMLASEERLENLAREIRRTYPNCSAHLCVGDAADKVALMADILRVDLILVGSHHPKLLGRLLGLDQTERIMHQAPCPVLAYSPSTSRS
jgi:nucleotide-binding universal stress UspA family protein